MDYQQRLNRQSAARSMARGLGWFSVALGAAELVFAGPLAKALGMRGDENLIRFYGAREVANGLGALAARDPGPWMWGRVAGDAIDIATLATRLDIRRSANAWLALGAVAGVTALDIAAARALAKAYALSEPPARDYSDRTGFPKPPEAMRGAARDFSTPQDLRTPDGMRPLLH
jgi:hypothetical protein